MLTLRLDNLAPDAARRVLERSGVSDNALAAGVNRIARGHPLSLQLAAGALAARPELARADVAVTPMLEELAALYLSSLDGSTRRALDAACAVRRATVSLLAAMLPDDPPADAFEALRRLPFVDVGPEGLLRRRTRQTRVRWSPLE